MGLLFSRRRVPSCRKHASHTGERRLRRPCVRCLAPLGQGALPVCVFDAVCPCGAKALQRGAPDFAGRFAHQETFPARRETGNGAIVHFPAGWRCMPSHGRNAPFSRQNLPHHPTAANAALYKTRLIPHHPAGRTAGSARTRPRGQPLGNPFLGDGNRFPRGSRPPTAAGGKPLLVGRACVESEPTAPAGGTAAS